jgi:hypothetical protein
MQCRMFTRFPLDLRGIWWKLPIRSAPLADPELSPQSEEYAKLAQKLGQLQPFTAVFPQECMGQLASFGPT